ncbi:DUF4149 domain-containing protein [Hydromonas duriensis]|uniref:Uncharacterized protein DUF4149 n=1 Tax=Hydromonas duriensis TaxID=1527608 RepID=A0A4R6YAV7_9BURK|nr:DUF4149 domain-containing protein [Hydromonas duriensis]TDR32722.1 uncharacterized protein DUF4149 [Hydromonas duriensis]
MKETTTSRIQGALSLVAHFALVLWAGATWGAGYVFAPALFASFPTALAGEAAGVMFKAVNVMGLACAMVVVLDLRLRFSQRLHHQPEVWWLLGLVFLVLVQYVGLAPKMAALKILFPDAYAMASFGRLHAVSQVIYLLQSSILVFLLWRRLSRPK